MAFAHAFCLARVLFPLCLSGPSSLSLPLPPSPELHNDPNPLISPPSLRLLYHRYCCWKLSSVCLVYFLSLLTRMEMSSGHQPCLSVPLCRVNPCPVPPPPSLAPRGDSTAYSLPQLLFQTPHDCPTVPGWKLGWHPAGIWRP